MSYWTRRNRLDNNHNLFVCKVGKANYIIVEVYCIDLDVIDEINMSNAGTQQQFNNNGAAMEQARPSRNTLPTPSWCNQHNERDRQLAPSFYTFY